MTVYKNRRLPAASPGDRSPISFFKPRQIIPVRRKPIAEKGTGPHKTKRCTGLPRRKSVLPAPVFPSFPNKKSPAFGEPPGTFKERESIGCFLYEIKKSAPPYRFSGDSSKSGETSKHIDSWSTVDIILRVNFSGKSFFEKFYPMKKARFSRAFPVLTYEL